MSNPTVVPDLYATPTDYASWTGTELPETGLPTLRACSGLVADATVGAVYDTDPNTGLPIDSSTAGALRDATCIQAAAWIALGIDPLTGGVRTLTAGGATSRKIGSAVITRSETETAAVAAAAAAARTELVPDAAVLLSRFGLLSVQVWT